jgi:adenylate cyclase
VSCRRLVLDDSDIALTNALLKGPAPEAPGVERSLAVLFADIRGFTSMSEALPPYDVVHILNRYFLQMGRVIGENAGIINNYMGDGFMALFGTADPEHAAIDSVKAAVGMLEAMVPLKAYMAAAYRQSFEIGIGIHHGSVVVGHVGSRETKQLTAIGDVVNLASRIESANKEVGSRLLISEPMFQLVKDQVTVGRSASLAVKGKTGEYCVYEIVGLRQAPVR